MTQDVSRILQAMLDAVASHTIEPVKVTTHKVVPSTTDPVQVITNKVLQSLVPRKSPAIT